MNYEESLVAETELKANGYTVTEESASGQDYINGYFCWYNPSGELVGEGLMYKSNATEISYRNYLATTLGKENTLIKNGYRKEVVTHDMGIFRKYLVTSYDWYTPDGEFISNMNEDLSTKAAYLHYQVMYQGLERKTLPTAYIRFYEFPNGKQMAMSLISVNGEVLETMTTDIDDEHPTKEVFNSFTFHEHELFAHKVEKPYRFVVLADGSVKTVDEYQYPNSDIYGQRFTTPEMLEIFYDKKRLDDISLAQHVTDPNGEYPMTAEERTANYRWNINIVDMVDCLILNQVILSGIASVGIDSDMD